MPPQGPPLVIKPATNCWGRSFCKRSVLRMLPSNLPPRSIATQTGHELS